MTKRHECDFERFGEKCSGPVRIPERGFYAVCDRHEDQHTPPKDFSLCSGDGYSGHAGEIRWQSDPFLAEIHEDFTEMWLCNLCAYESSMDI